MALKILLCGDVLGRLDQLLKRVSSVNKSNGPFDAVFCVGQFFSTDESGVAEILAYIEGKKEIFLPTYFIGDYGEGASLVLSSAKSKVIAAGLNHEGISICKNLYWLKGGGVLNFHGLRIAYLGGKYDTSKFDQSSEPSFSGVYQEDDVGALRAAADDPEIVDIFLTNEWPRGIFNGTDLSKIRSEFEPTDNGNPIIADLARELKPRYHVAGSENRFYARDPYINEAAIHVTRFLGLASLGNSSKQKFLHALAPTPASALTSTDLALRPQNTTPSPYTVAKARDAKQSKMLGASAKRVGSLSEEAEGQYWRYEVPQNKRSRHNASDDNGMKAGVCFDFVKKGKCSRGEHCRFSHDANAVRTPGGASSESCWFCLSSPNVDSHLVVSVGEGCYCALAKGALVEGHVLIVPIKHASSTLSLPLEDLKEIRTYKESLKNYFKSQGKSMIVFERYVETKAATHTHLQVVPLPLSKACTARSEFVSVAKNLDFEYEVVRPGEEDMVSPQSLQKIVRGQNYFYAELPEGTVLIHPIEEGEKIPIQMGREVAAKILGTPERGDWKNCKLSKEDETKLAENFRKAFKKFDPTE